MIGRKRRTPSTDDLREVAMDPSRILSAADDTAGFLIDNDPRIRRAVEEANRLIVLEESRRLGL